MDTEQLDLDLGPEPPLVAPVARLQAGHRALRRRRLAQGVAGTVAAFAVGGIGWALVPGPSTHTDSSIAVAPTPTVMTELPLQKPGECLNELCVELVPHGMRPLFPAVPGGDVTLSFRDGRLVRLSPGVDVVKAIVDPTATGATESAAVEVVFRKTRFRVAMAQGFGYVSDQVDGTPKTSLKQWFAARHDLPEKGACAVQSPEHDIAETDMPDPGECWLTVDEDGSVRPRAGVTIEREATPEMPDGALPPGVRVTAASFTRQGKEWYGVVVRVGDRAFVSTALALVGDLAPGTTLEKWAVKTAPEISMTGIPDPDHRAGDQRAQWRTLSWWDPTTGAFEVPPGAAVIKHVANPMKYAAPDNSAGLVFVFRDQRYWALTQVHTGTGVGDDDFRTSAVTVPQAKGMRSHGDFDSWLTATGADLTQLQRAAK